MISCSNLIISQKATEPGTLPTHLGNKTECSLLQFVCELGADYEAIRKDHTEEDFHKVRDYHYCNKTLLISWSLYRSWVSFLLDLIGFFVTIISWVHCGRKLTSFPTRCTHSTVRESVWLPSSRLKLALGCLSKVRVLNHLNYTPPMSLR